MEEYDFGLCWTSDAEQYLFINILRKECTQRSLRFILIDENNLQEISAALKKHKIKINFCLDLASDTPNLEDVFTRFVYQLKDTDTRVVADPDLVRFFADKSITHFQLLKAGIPVPYSVIIRNWDPNRRLSEEEREQLGIPLVIKPAMGYGQKGVNIVRKRLTLREIALARDFSPGDNFLLQRYIEPKSYGDDPAWYRIFYLFGEVAVCWWNPQTGVYRQVTLREFDQYKLSSLPRIASEIASLTGIEWFTCEIAMDSKTEEYIVIDYMNDQFDISSKTQRPAGVPDELLLLLARRIVAKAWDYKLEKFPLTHRAVWFTRMKLKDEDA